MDKIVTLRNCVFAGMLIALAICGEKLSARSAECLKCVYAPEAQCAPVIGMEQGSTSCMVSAEMCHETGDSCFAKIEG